jgi:uncharacterized protein YkvS
LDLLTNAGHDYVLKATEAIKNTMMGSSAKHVIETIEFLNANTAVLSKVNAELVAATRARKETKKTKKSSTRSDS